MRYLAVDPGGRRLGLAVGDDTTGVITPLAVIPYRGLEAAADSIAAQARRLGAERIVIGLPTAADGSRTPACRRSEALAQAVEERGLPVHLQPEHLSSWEARARARRAGVRPGEPVDHLAAQVILEEFLAGRGP